MAYLAVKTERYTTAYELRVIRGWQYNQHCGKRPWAGVRMSKDVDEGAKVWTLATLAGFHRGKDGETVECQMHDTSSIGTYFWKQDDPLHCLWSIETASKLERSCAVNRLSSSRCLRCIVNTLKANTHRLSCLRIDEHDEQYSTKVHRLEPLELCLRLQVLVIYFCIILESQY